MNRTDRRPRIVIAGSHSGTGKTTLSIGLMAAFYLRGFVVQGYKVGPDFIDPSYHTGVTGRPSRNLDAYMCARTVVEEIFYRGSNDADISVIEGVMGLYDGKSSMTETGSTAELSKWIDAPVVLCIDVSGMARSAAATVLGYQKFDSAVNIVGVIANYVGSAEHFGLVQEAIEESCDVPVLGYLPKVAEIELPERHLGLIPAVERGELDSLFDRLASQIEKTVDLDAVLTIAGAASPMSQPTSSIFNESVQSRSSISSETSVGKETLGKVVIAVAKDAAFNFYYPENVELLESHGAGIVYFSPLNGEPIPDEARGLYVGGGFPEEFAQELAHQTSVFENFRDQILEHELPTFAECGGYMFLCNTVTTHDGRTYPMVGIIPADISMEGKLVGFGYREVTAIQDTVLLRKNETARGHEFHYSSIRFRDEVHAEIHVAYKTLGFRASTYEGYANGNLTAGYTHLHFASNPHIAKRFVMTCRKFKKSPRFS
ncbi:cobyrinate a,c-diamide synthase [Alicyclobacillus sp. SO9]|uniref:cobyrinate a,c-diamide synthase n=1 Tax=Alicyclobacillus sp. SO9 TaxID=2665646 RepID=UPI001E52BAED|nr:cobyrinate a,c-diamide synthase [Alicyclobacillus sp. SO9]